MKKKRVPAALRFELTEYASLLRALRTKDAMDLAAHLTKPSPFTLPPRNDELESNLDTHLDDELLDEPDVNSRGTTAGPSNLNHPINKAITNQTSGKVAPKRKRDQWTRWPLLLEDVPIPEWTLEDEVAAIASQVMKARLPPTFPTYEGPLEHDDPSHTDYVMKSEDEEDDPDHPFYVPYLTSIIASLLSTIFSLLAKHTPFRPASMQNRIEPLNWRSVIDVIVACDVSEYSNPKMVENVIRRMEPIYGPSFSPLEGKVATSYRAVERMRTKRAATEQLHKLLEEPMSRYFSQASPPPDSSPLSPPPPPSPPSPKRKRDQKFSLEERNYKVRKHWVPKAKRGQEQCDNESQGDSEISQQSVRRSARVRSKVTYNDTMEE